MHSVPTGPPHGTIPTVVKAMAALPWRCKVKHMCTNARYKIGYLILNGLCRRLLHRILFFFLEIHTWAIKPGAVNACTQCRIGTIDPICRIGIHLIYTYAAEQLTNQHGLPRKSWLGRLQNEAFALPSSSITLNHWISSTYHRVSDCVIFLILSLNGHPSPMRQQATDLPCSFVSTISQKNAQSFLLSPNLQELLPFP